MVNREVIEEVISKSIDETISKSHQHLTLQHTNVKKPMDKFAHSTRKRKREKAIMLNNDGKEVFSKNGGESYVDLGSEEIIKDLYKEHGELHIDHNHPSVDLPYAETLSPTDCHRVTDTIRYYSMYNGWGEYLYPYKSITAEGSNGSRMTLVRGDKFSDKDKSKFYEAVKKYDKYSSEYGKKFWKLQGEIYSDLIQKARNGELSDVDSIHDLATQETLKKVGELEGSDEFKSIQRDFRNCNCKLTVEWIDI